MNTRISSHIYNGGACGLACGAKAGIALFFIFAALALGASHDGAPVINKAIAAPEASTFYFPAQFPLSEGLPEPTLEMY